MIQNKKSLILCYTLPLVFSDFENFKTDKAAIKLFQLHISEFKGKEKDLMNFLDPKEVERSERFHFPKDKHTFIICRAVLKLLLAKFTDSNISKISIEPGSDKKPYLKSHPEVFFNLSHASDYAFLAIGTRPVGVDIEKIQEEFDYKEILSHMLSQKEMEELLKSQQPRENFYKTWTRKEAIVKATGKGIDNDFMLIPTKDGLNTVQLEFLGDIQRLEVKSFFFEKTYIGALAYPSDGVNFCKISSYRIPVTIYD